MHIYKRYLKLCSSNIKLSELYTLKVYQKNVGIFFVIQVFTHVEINYSQYLNIIFICSYLVIFELYKCMILDATNI